MAGVEETWRQERQFIAACVDVRALLNRMAEYRDARATTEARGYTAWRLRLDELLELAEARVVELKVRAMAPTEARPRLRDELRGAATRRTTLPPARPASLSTPAPSASRQETPRGAPSARVGWRGEQTRTTVPAGLAGVKRPAVAGRSVGSEKAPPGAPALTGEDLLRWRKQRGLTQRAAAALLGVAHGTVGKAEMLPRSALGEALTVALGRVGAA